MRLVLRLVVALVVTTTTHHQLTIASIPWRGTVQDLINVLVVFIEIFLQFLHTLTLVLLLILQLLHFQLHLPLFQFFSLFDFGLVLFRDKDFDFGCPFKFLYLLL